jgi:hypothetical protein
VHRPAAAAQALIAGKRSQSRLRAAFFMRRRIVVNCSPPDILHCRKDTPSDILARLSFFVQASMSTFLMILLSVAIVIATLLALSYFWLRRKVRTAVGMYKNLVPYFIHCIARMKLRIESLPARDEVDPEEAAQLDAMEALWKQLAAQGVKQLATLASGEDTRIIAGQHPDSRMLALVIRPDARAPYLEFNTARVITGEPGAQALQLPSLSVELDADARFDTALARLAVGQPGRALDSRMLILLIERLYATRMDSQLTREPTLADTKARAIANGIEYALDEAEEVRIVEMNRSSWLEGLRVALLDHARRKLQLDEEPWSRLDEELIVIHNALNADEVIATLSDIALVEQLGEQLKRQNYSPSQIFDEINRRLDPEQRRSLVLQLGVPRPARVFATSRALEAAGVTLNLEAA